MRNPKACEQGMTLVEVMIAMVLGLILTVGILQVFVSNKQVYRATENISRLQENGRFAMSFISRDIRMADFWGCSGSAVSLESNLKPDPDFDLPIAALAGFNDDSAANSVTNGTDTITIKGVFNSGIRLVSTPASPLDDLKVLNNSGLAENDMVLIGDCVDGDIFQITNDPSDAGTPLHDNVAHNITASPSGASEPGNIDGDLKKIYSANANVYKLNFASYTIQDGTSGLPSLFRGINGGVPQELVESIENMQILYGEDTNGDGAPNYYLESDTAGINMDNVVAVRVSLTVATIDDNVSDQTSTHSTLGTTDKRIRRVFTSTIVLRNRLP